MNLVNNCSKLKFFLFVLILLTITLLFLFYEDLTKNLCFSSKKLAQSNSKFVPLQSEQKLNLQVKFDRSVINNWIQTFNDSASRIGTDKVTYHHYEYLYGQFLGPLRFSEINFLEIGLGCNMPYGPGKSIILWKEFFTKASVSVLEFDEKCAQKFVNEVKNLFTGDQSNFDVLNNIGKYGPYDVIVDDGGHSRKQQVNSLIGLWPFVKSKGFYVIEDIFTSFMLSYNDNEENAIDVIFQLILLLNEAADIKAGTVLPKKISISEHSKSIARDLLFISCFQRVCILNKK